MSYQKRKLEKNIRLITRLLKDWRSFKYLPGDPGDRMCARTEKHLKKIFREEHEFYQKFKEINSLFADADIQLFEIGLYHELEKWDKAKELMVELIESVLTALKLKQEQLI
jgi:hypothetical protein